MLYISNLTHFFQFRGPEVLVGAFARGIMKNNAGCGYIFHMVENNGFKATANLTQYIIEQDKKRIEGEETYQKKEIGRRVKIVKEAITGPEDSAYKSGAYN